MKLKLKYKREMKMNFNDREKIVELTPLWKGERLPDGRPKVEDKYLDALYGMTLEEVWKPIFVLGYEHQFVGGGENPLNTLHDDGRKLVGRAVTCTYCPTRPDLHDVQFARGAEDGLQGNYNQWVIDHLYERDVVVCDMYDKIYKGTFLGGNLTTALHNRTKTGGAVIWGGIRDVEQMKKVPDVQVYYRGIDPTPIREFVMKDWNDITNFGGAVCLRVILCSVRAAACFLYPRTLWRTLLRERLRPTLRMISALK